AADLLRTLGFHRVVQVRPAGEHQDVLHDGSSRSGSVFTGLTPLDPGDRQQGPADHDSGRTSSMLCSPATRVSTTVASASPRSRSCLRSSSGVTAVPRFFTVTRPTPRSRRSPRSRFTPNGSTSVTSYDVPYGVAGTASVVTYAIVGSTRRPSTR